MKRLSKLEIKALALRLRHDLGLTEYEPIHVKSILRKANILTSYQPMSEHAYGLSLRANDMMFILVNSNSTRGRQHYTIAHELFHLYFDPELKPHLCSEETAVEEANANRFASAFLMPEGGLIAMIPQKEIQQKNLSIATLLRLGQYFSVSHQTLLIRLSELDLLTPKQLETYKALPIKETARLYGYDTSLYESGNENLVIGDFGEKNRLLYDAGKISEGHYLELLNSITNGKSEDQDSAGC